MAFKSNTKIYPFTERLALGNKSVPRNRDNSPGLRIAVGGNEDTNHNYTDRPNLNHGPKFDSGGSEPANLDSQQYTKAKLLREVQALDPARNKELNAFAELLLSKLKSFSKSDKASGIDLLAFFLDKKFSKVESEAEGKEALNLFACLLINKCKKANMRGSHVENMINIIKRGGQECIELDSSHAGRRSLGVFAGLLLNNYRGTEVETLDGGLDFLAKYLKKRRKEEGDDEGGAPEGLGILAELLGEGGKGGVRPEALTMLGG